MLIQLINLRHWRRHHLKYSVEHEQGTIYKLARLFCLLIALILIHSMAMVYFENLGWGDAFWLSVTTVTTVGYGDISAASWQGRLFTTVCLYVLAISLLAQLAAEFFEYRIKKRDDKFRGNWIWSDMNKHLLIINTPTANSDAYLERLIGQVRATPKFAQLPLQILSRNYSGGLPRELSAHNVVHYNGGPEHAKNLDAVNVKTAAFIVILARDGSDPLSDSLTFDILCRIQDVGSSATILAECIADENRQRLKKAGAAVVIRPIRAYPELLVRALATPGTEVVLENLFTHDESNLQRVDLDFSNILWRDIVSVFMANDFGIPLAYIDAGGVHSNPPALRACSGSSIISMTSAGRNIPTDKIRADFTRLHTASNTAP
ncbi:MAG: potassium channel family protein [Candidatus Reddybacter sp.]